MAQAFNPSTREAVTGVPRQASNPYRETQNKEINKKWSPIPITYVLLPDQCILHVVTAVGQRVIRIITFFLWYHAKYLLAS